MNDDPFHEYSQTEVVLYTTDVRLVYDHYDKDDLKNENSGELQASIGDVGIRYIQTFEDHTSNIK